MAKRLGLAVIGLGMASKPHLLALQDLPERIEVRGVLDRSEEACARVSETYGFPIAESAEALAKDPSVDAVTLITPPNARLDLVRLFASAGKHILSEKPVERTTAAAEDIVAICEDAGIALSVVFQHRFRKASEALARLLADGALGDIRLVRAEVPWWRDQAYYDEPGRGTYTRDGGGVLISQAIHTLDLMLSLAGPVASVQALCATTPFHRMEAEDFAAGAVVFETGAVGSIFASTSNFPGDAESLAFDCDKASVLLKSGVLTVNWRDGRTETHGEEAGTGGGADPMAFPFDWHKSMYEDFSEAVVTGRPPRITGAEALNVHRLIGAIEASSRDGRRIEISQG